MEDDVALLADEYLAVSGAADAGLVGDIDGVFVKARFEAIVVVGHGGTHFGIGQFGNDFRIAAQSDGSDVGQGVAVEVESRVGPFQFHSVEVGVFVD